VDIYDLRRRKLRALVDERFRRSRTAFGEATGLQSDYVSRLLSGKSPSAGGKNLGEALARDLETKLHLERGWFDRDADGTVGDAPPPAYALPGDPSDPGYYPALIAQRVRHWDGRMQLLLADFIEAMNRAMGDTQKGTRHSSRRAKKPR
jgi:hypothetical protein